jgi:hypothetical protein
VRKIRVAVLSSSPIVLSLVLSMQEHQEVSLQNLTTAIPIDNTDRVAATLHTPSFTVRPTSTRRGLVDCKCYVREWVLAKLLRACQTVNTALALAEPLAHSFQARSRGALHEIVKLLQLNNQDMNAHQSCLFARSASCFVS